MIDPATVEDSSEAPEAKLCTGCLRRLPLAQFRIHYKAKGTRHSQCNECRSEEERSRRADKKQKTFAKFYKKINASDCDTVVVVALCGEIVRRLGGLNQFLAKLFQSVEAAQAAGRLDLVTSFHQTVLNLAIVSNQLIESSRPNCDLLSDEDLLKQAQKDLVQLVRANPQLALWAASKLPEWTLVPTGESRG